MNYKPVKYLWMGLVIVGIPASANPPSTLSKLPVKEITVFKDGHSFILHEGTTNTDANGNVRLDYLPTPVLGTFWPCSATKHAALTAVVAGTHAISVSQTAAAINDMVRSNRGAKVRIHETGGSTIDAEIAGVPERGSEMAPGAESPAPAVPGTVVLLKTDGGTLALPMDRIQKIEFKGPYVGVRTVEEHRNVLTMKLKWDNDKAEKAARVGMVYVQRGIRWIPGYKVVIDGKGNAHLKLQATIVNELTDLVDVSANLVIGVPSFAFKDMPDPISLQQSFAQLSSHFDQGARTGFALSNGIMSQAGGFGGRGGGQQPQPTADPEVAGSAKVEDLFVFNVKHLTLAKGERMVVPVTEYELKYKDVYSLEVQFGPPTEWRSGANSEQQLELARLLASPKVRHKIRITNKSTQPFTTAPALLLNGEQVMGQSIMTYTSPGGEVDLDLASAIDISVKKTEKEISRTPNAANWQNSTFAKIDLEGSLKLTNRKSAPVEVEVTKFILGTPDKVSGDGKLEMVNALDDSGSGFASDRPAWWGWYNWPYWWYHLNGIGRFTWTVKLEPNKPIDMSYNWHYFWQ